MLGVYSTSLVSSHCSACGFLDKTCIVYDNACKT